jgi:hypothetical protein
MQTVAHDFEQTEDDAAPRDLPKTQSDGPVAMNNPMTIYLVTAYRWGSSNRHQYQVYCGIDKTKANALARAEVADRGGKYDCVVYEFTADGVDYKPLAYFAAYQQNEGRTDAQHDHYRDFLERLGHFMCDAAGGKALLPCPEDPSRLTYQDIECPQVFKTEVERQQKTMALYQRVESAESSDKTPTTPV